MANMEQVQIVRQGRDAVARWREEHPGENFDLNTSYMSHARIPQVDLSGSDIRDSDFMGAMLRRSNLSGCFMNSVHMYRANLREANLSDVLMNGANLVERDLALQASRNATLGVRKRQSHPESPAGRVANLVYYRDGRCISTFGRGFR